MAYTGPTVAYGDSIADGIAKANQIPGVAIIGKGLGYDPSSMPSVDKIPKGAPVVMSVGWNDIEFANGGEKPTRQTRQNNYNTYVDNVAAKIEEIKQRTGAGVVLLKLEQGAANMGQYGNTEQIDTVNKALAEAAARKGIKMVSPNTGRGGGDPHYSKKQSETILANAELQLNGRQTTPVIAANQPPPVKETKPPVTPDPTTPLASRVTANTRPPTIHEPVTPRLSHNTQKPHSDIQHQRAPAPAHQQPVLPGLEHDNFLAALSRTLSKYVFHAHHDTPDSHKLEDAHRLLKNSGIDKIHDKETHSHSRNNVPHVSINLGRGTHIKT